MITFFVVAGSVAVSAAFLLCKSLRSPPSEVKDEPEPKPMPPPKPSLPAARIIVRDRR